MKKFSPQIVLLLLLAAVVPAFSHAHMHHATPAPDSTVKVWPAAVKLEFSEGIEPKFATFRVYRLAVPTTASDSAAKTAADKSADGMLAAKADSAVRADASVSLASSNTQATVALKSGMKPGWYAVAWKVVSDDGHIMRDHFVFRCAP